MTSIPRYIKHKNINKNKWDDCINQSFNRLPYALSWYLDLISPNWDAIILEDYKTVMPLTHRSKFGIKYITKPVLCHQLGVFSTIHNSSFVVDDFIEAIPKKFVSIDMPLNSYNIVENSNINQTTKINQFISLANSYENIESSFKKQHKKNIRRFSNNIDEYKIEDDSYLHLIEKKQSMLKSRSIKQSKADDAVYKRTLGYLSKAHKLKVQCVKNADGKITGGMGICFVEDYVFPISYSTPYGKNIGDKYYLLNKFIKQNANSNTTYDFMGSSIKGIYDWNKGFGATEVTFPFIHTKNLPF